jgi:hypothetical protein
MAPSFSRRCGESGTCTQHLTRVRVPCRSAASRDAIQCRRRHRSRCKALGGRLPQATRQSLRPIARWPAATAQSARSVLGRPPYPSMRPGFRWLIWRSQSSLMVVASWSSRRLRPDFPLRRPNQLDFASCLAAPADRGMARPEVQQRRRTPRAMTPYHTLAVSRRRQAVSSIVHYDFYTSNRQSH